MTTSIWPWPTTSKRSWGAPGSTPSNGAHLRSRAARPRKSSWAKNRPRPRALAGDDRGPRLEADRRQHPVRADPRKKSKPSRSTGFSRRAARDRDPDRGATHGLQEFGLPFVADPAVPKHLSQFLRRHRAESRPGISRAGHTGMPSRPARPPARRDPLQRRRPDA